jgi:hypothetical protein
MHWRALVAVSVLGTSALSPSRHATWDASLCSLDMHGENLCLPPTRVRQVERLLPIAIDPTALVWRETHLRLTQVVSRGYIKRPFGIVYVYGHLSIGKSGVLDYAVSRPKFVTVNEVETDRSTGYAPPRLGLLTPLLHGNSVLWCSSEDGRWKCSRTCLSRSCAGWGGPWCARHGPGNDGRLTPLVSSPASCMKTPQAGQSQGDCPASLPAMLTSSSRRRQTESGGAKQPLAPLLVGERCCRSATM